MDKLIATIPLLAGPGICFLVLALVLKKFIEIKQFFRFTTPRQTKLIKTATLITAILAAIPACAPPVGWMLAGGFGCKLGDQLGPSKAGKLLGFTLGLATVPIAMILFGAVCGLLLGMVISIFIKEERKA